MGREDLKLAAECEIAKVFLVVESLMEYLDSLFSVGCGIAKAFRRGKISRVLHYRNLVRDWEWR